MTSNTLGARGLVVDSGHGVESRSWFAVIFYLAAALFAANFSLGILVQLGVVDTKPFRWLHHALFFAVAASAALAAAWGILRGELYGWILLPALVLYFFLPRVRAGTPQHAGLATLALIFYAGAGITLTV